jgi:arabinose-5-phosphate isomerase
MTEILTMLKAVVRKEADSLLAVEAGLTKEAVEVVKELMACEGRVALSGIGKAGLIARKISATFASTGTPSYWLDPVNALHGDLGMVDSKDAVILISNSGSSGEILLIAEALGGFGVCRIAMTRDTSTPLAQMCEKVLPIGDHQEACPLNLAPSCSTTAMLALGDAVALTVQQLQGFTQDDYGRRHPSGSLGRRLKRVSQCMRTGAQLPILDLTATLVEAVHEISSKRCGLCVVLDETGKLLGVFTDGDFRRCWEGKVDFSSPLGDHATVPCQSIAQGALVRDAIQVMRSSKINGLPVVDCENRVVGIIDIQDVA